MKKHFLSTFAISCILMTLAIPSQSSSSQEKTFGQDDLAKIIKTGSKNNDGTQRKTIGFMRNYKDNLFIIDGKLVAYGNNSANNYSVVWVSDGNKGKVGCLANSDSNLFDDFAIGDTVKIKGKIHHIDYTNSDQGYLILGRGCTLSKK